MTRSRIRLAALLLFSAIHGTVVFTAVAQQATDETVELASRVEALWLRRDEPASMRSALDLYERLAALQPGRSETHIRMSRAFWWYGMLQPRSQVIERRELFRRGISAARRAQQLAPDEPGPYYWEAVNRVHAVTAKGGFVTPNEILRIRKLLLKVDELNSWYHHGSIRYVEAELILRLPALQRWLMGRRIRSAVDLALTALGFENSCLYGHWMLARALAASGRKGAAIAQIESIQEADPDAFFPDAPENRVIKRWAISLRQEIEGKDLKPKGDDR